MKKMILTYALVIPVMSTIKAQGTAEEQNNTEVGVIDVQQAEQKVNPITFSGYAEAYYGFDFNQPSNNTRPGFVYSHNRHNEVNINLAFLKGSYVVDRTRAHVALGVGTYMNANYSAEPGVLKNIYEANAGVKISKKADLWIDAGLMSSHIGFESAHTPSCWTLTRSIIADNSPYFESGARLSYTSKNGQWYLAGLVLNGWQRIQRVDGNSTIGGGTQITFKPSGNVTLNYSTFFGNDKPDSVHQTRIFQNVYGIFQVTEKFGIIADLDYGMEQKSKGSSDWNNWLGTALILQYKPTKTTAIAVRGEYYTDEKGVIIATGTPNGFNTSGFSANFDCYILNNVLWRIEGKLFNSEDAIFTDKGGAAANTSPVATTSLSISF
ncbi:MAG TPA: porin [Flavipsychrobacter sp.]